MNPFARGARKKLSAARQAPRMKAKVINLSAAEIQDEAAARMAARLCEVATENEKLRAQVAELLPWAIHSAERIQPGELIAPRVGKPEAILLLRRVEAGDFGEVAS